MKIFKEYGGFFKKQIFGIYSKKIFLCRINV
jgi:hypothetical protein